MSPGLTGKAAPAPGLKRGLGGTSPLARYPRLYLAVARRRYGDRIVGADTDIMIEGFPRSANTFAVTAFRFAQPGPVVVAHHLHAVAHVARAVELGVPVMLLVRAPEDAVRSVLARKPGQPPAAVAEAYARFYEGVVPHLERCVVAEFEQVTTDLGTVIDRVNERFGTAFARFEHTDENVQRCFARIEEESRRRADGVLVENAVARPSSDRTPAAGLAVSPELRARLDRAYDAVVEHAAR